MVNVGGFDEQSFLDHPLRDTDIALSKRVIHPAGEGSREQVYDDRREETVLSTVSNILQTDDFARYCKANGKGKAGGYIEASVKMVKNFGIMNED